MGVSYRDLSSPLVHTSQHGIWVAGDRCPDLQLVLPSGEEKWLYSTVTYGKYLILSLGRHLDIDSKYQDIVTTFTIVPATAGSETGISDFEKPLGEKAMSGSTFTARWLAPDDRAVIVVRPDMYIGYVADDRESWRDYLQATFSGGV